MSRKKIVVALGCSIAIAGLSWAAFLGNRALAQRSLGSAHYEPAPEGMVLVPAGTFLLGSKKPDAPPDEGKLRHVFLPAFYIDQFEVTNEEYKRFNPNFVIPPGHEKFPVTGLSLEQARAYAAGVGKRIPTADEWEKAARGTDGREYPWGAEYREGYANLGGKEDLVEVGSFPKGVSPCGAQDMAGNAWEWVETPYIQKGLFGQKLYHTEVIKGGAFSYSPFQGRASYNGFEGIGGTCHDVGFRCVKDASPSSIPANLPAHSTSKNAIP